MDSLNRRRFGVVALIAASLCGFASAQGPQDHAKHSKAAKAKKAKKGHHGKVLKAPLKLMATPKATPAGKGKMVAMLSLRGKAAAGKAAVKASLVKAPLKAMASVNDAPVAEGKLVAMLAPPPKAATVPGAPAPAGQPAAPGATPALAAAPDPTAGTIKGSVKSVPFEEGLSKATVTVKGTKISAITDQQGRYQLDNVPAGNQVLTVAFAGSKTVDIPVEVKANQTVSVMASVVVKDSSGEEIVVVGSRFPEKRLESPVTVETVKPADVQMLGAQSYMAALSQVRGLDYADTGIGEKRVSSRGFATSFSSRMLFTIDGRLAALPGSGLPMGSLLPTPTLDIHSMEIVLGPASALYGANATAGVVNVITKTPWDDPGTSVAVRGGTQYLLDAAGRVAGTINKNWGYKFTAQVNRANDWVPDRNQQSFFYGTTAMPVFEADLVNGNYGLFSARAEGFGYARFDDWNVKAGAGWSTTDAYAMTDVGRNALRGWQVNYQTAQISSTHWFAEISHTSTEGGKTYQMDRLASWVAASGGATAVTPGQMDTWRDLNPFVDHSSMLDSELQYRNDFKNGLTLVSGLDARYYNPVSAGTYLSDIHGTTLTRTELGGYLQLDYQLIPKTFRAVGAARVDTNSDYAPQFSPKVAFVWTPEKNTALRLSYNHAFRSPTILQDYLLLYGFAVGDRTGFVIKDAAGSVLRDIKPLSPEQVDSIEASYRASVLEDHLQLFVVGYHSWYNNFISGLTPRANPANGEFAFYANTGVETATGMANHGTLWTYANFGAARVVGTDFGADFTPMPGTTLNGGISLINMYKYANNEPSLAPTLLNVPSFKARAGVTLLDLFVKKTYLKLATRYQNAYPFASGRWKTAAFLPDGQVPARFVADVAFGFTFDSGVKVAANITNLFDDHGVDVLGVAPAGRFAYVSLEYKFTGLDF